MEAVVELAEHAVEQVSECGGVLVAVGFAVVVVVFGWSWSGQGGEGPDESDGVESVVFDAAAGDGVRVRPHLPNGVRVDVPSCRRVETVLI